MAPGFDPCDVLDRLTSRVTRVTRVLRSGEGSLLLLPDQPVGPASVPTVSHPQAARLCLHCLLVLCSLPGPRPSSEGDPSKGLLVASHVRRHLERLPSLPVEGPPPAEVWVPCPSSPPRGWGSPRGLRPGLPVLWASEFTAALVSSPGGGGPASPPPAELARLPSRTPFPLSAPLTAGAEEHSYLRELGDRVEKLLSECWKVLPV